MSMAKGGPHVDYGKVVEFVSQHQGCSRRDILSHFGLDAHTSCIGWLTRAGRLIATGRHTQRRYFTDQQAADALGPALAAVERDMRKHVARTRETDRSQDRRPTFGRTALHAPDGRVVLVDLAGVTLSPALKITVAPKPRQPFAPEHGWERAITSDWMLRRQGVTV